MSKKKFSKKQIRQWRAYERVRESGRWNMYWPQARMETGLSEKDYRFVMDNYSALADQAKGEQ